MVVYLDPLRDMSLSSNVLTKDDGVSNLGAY